MARHDGRSSGHARPAQTRATIVQQIEVCDEVIDHLTALRTRDLADLIEDVKNLRASLQLRVAGADRDGYLPAT
jgi:hypothetical protein